MQKSLLILSLVGLMGSSVAARTLSPSEALSRALSTTATTGGQHRAPVMKAPVMTVGEASAPALYVFDQGNEGYLIVSANDVAAPVLGYSSTGTFDPDNLPENMRWWLSQYKLEIEAAANSGTQSYSRAGEDTRTPVAPLLKTTWDQSNPYNLQTPVLRYTDGTQKQSVTGCVATAMAQVMKHHSWPKKFNANFAYASQYFGTLTWVEQDVELRWEDMLDSYSGVYTLEDPAAKAVSTLMKACGYSVDMNYTPVESGAASILIAGAMVNTFGYDQGTYTALRQTYSLEDWENLLYTELAANRPVIYSGANSEDAGHCFVCDGYQNNGYFHINWGWSGMSDGYFLITALDPSSQGIGGSTSGFNLDQEALIGLQAPVEGSKQRIQLLCTGTFDMTYPQERTLMLHGPFTNYSTTEVKGKFGVRFVKDGKVVKETLGAEYTIGVSYMAPTVGINCIIPDGEYDVYPLFQPTGGKAIVIPCYANQAGYAHLVKNGNDVTITMPEKGQASITDLKFETPMYDGLPFMISGNAVWTGNNSVSIPVKGIFTKEKPTSKIVCETEVAAFGAPLAIEFEPDGQTVAFNYMNEALYDNEYPKNEVKLPVGKYYFSMVMEAPVTVANNTMIDNFQIISEPIEITNQSSPGNPETTLVNWNIENADNVDPKDITINMEVSCTGGYFFNSVKITVLGPLKDGQTNYMAQVFRTQLLSLHEGEKQNISTKIQLTDTHPGERYQVQFINPYTNKLYSQATYQNITIGDYTAIGDISADAVRGVSASPNPASDFTVITASSGIKRIDLAALSGSFVNVPVEIEGASARVDVSALASGLYIARVITEAGVESVKIIKK